MKKMKIWNHHLRILILFKNLIMQIKESYLQVMPKKHLDHQLAKPIIKIIMLIRI